MILNVTPVLHSSPPLHHPLQALMNVPTDIILWVQKFKSTHLSLSTSTWNTSAVFSLYSWAFATIESLYLDSTSWNLSCQTLTTSRPFEIPLPEDCDERSLSLSDLSLDDWRGEVCVCIVEGGVIGMGEGDLCAKWMCYVCEWVSERETYSFILESWAVATNITISILHQYSVITGLNLISTHAVYHAPQR